MGISISSLAHGILHYPPNIIQPLCEWLLGFSETSSTQDFRTALMVSVVRAIFNDPMKISMLDEQQASFFKGKTDKSLWVCDEVFQVMKDNNLAELVIQAIQQLSHENITLPDVSAEHVRGEWIGHRKSEGPKIAGAEQVYANLMEDLQSDSVMIYLHGGQFYLRDAASRREIVHELARRTGGRCIAISYRLSPQHTFPSALMDLLVVYLSLIYPSSNTHHLAVAPQRICICGDSSGANIAISMLQLILHLKRSQSSKGPMVYWNGRNVELPCPGAICTHSGYLDLTRSLPSEHENIKFDIIPSAAKPPAPQSKYLQDAIWPPLQPRHHVYAPDILLTHPLVSPLTATDWRNCSTKVWLSVGQECLADGNIILAQRMAEDGLDVALEVYEGMPHDFLVLLQSSSCGQECFHRWAEFVKLACVSDMPFIDNGTFGTASLRKPDGSWTREPVGGMQPQRNQEDLLEGMNAQIRSWGGCWSRQDQ